MKKRIGTKDYDTSTAEWIGASKLDPDADLYKKRTGEYFLCVDEKITPVSYSDAVSWAKENLYKWDFEKIFLIKENETAKENKFYILNQNIAKKVKKVAEKKNVSQSEMAAQLISFALEQLYNE